MCEQVYVASFGSFIFALFAAIRHITDADRDQEFELIGKIWKEIGKKSKVEEISHESSKTVISFLLNSLSLLCSSPPIAGSKTTSPVKSCEGLLSPSEL